METSDPGGDHAQSSGSDLPLQAALRRLDQRRGSLATPHTISPAEVNEEHTVYLVPVEDEAGLARWLARNHRRLFEAELEGWYTDPALWPRDRSLKMLKRWCSLELHTLVVDAGGPPLEDDEFED